MPAAITRGKPFGGFADFDSCVREIGQDPDIDDPEAYCASIQEAVEKGEVHPGDFAMGPTKVQYMSLVDTPAVGDSVFLKLKSKHPTIQRKNFVKLLLMKRKKGDELSFGQMLANEHVVIAPALIPGKKDGNGEICFEEQIVKAAIDYQENGRLVDKNHDLNETADVPVFNWILEKETTYETEDGEKITYPKFTWMVGVKIKELETWEDIVSGKTQGFSICGTWPLYEIKGQKGEKNMKENEGRTLSDSKTEFTRTLLASIKEFETEHDISLGGSIELERGNWPDDMSWDQYMKQPLQNISLNASIKSRSSAGEAQTKSKDVDEMDEKEVKEIAKAVTKDILAEQQKVKEEEQRLKDEDQEKEALKKEKEELLKEMASLKERLEKLEKQDDEDEDDEDDEKSDKEDDQEKEEEEEEDEDKAKEDDYEEEDDEDKKKSTKKKQVKRLSGQGSNEKTDPDFKPDGAKDLNKKALKIKHEGSRGFV